MTIPKLHFKYAYPLDIDRRKLFSSKDFGVYPSIEKIRNRIDEWKKIWNKINKSDRVFKLLIKIIGVTLPQDLELCIFGAGLKAMSFPLMISIIGSHGKKRTDDEFVETLIHEVIHRFIGDFENNKNIEKYWKKITKEYKNETILTQDHILVYAILETVLLKLFGKERLKDFINPWQPEYQRAVAIVAEKGAQNLIKQFRDIVLGVNL